MTGKTVDPRGPLGTPPPGHGIDVRLRSALSRLPERPLDDDRSRAMVERVVWLAMHSDPDTESGSFDGRHVHPRWFRRPRAALLGGALLAAAGLAVVTWRFRVREPRPEPAVAQLLAPPSPDRGEDSLESGTASAHFRVEGGISLSAANEPLQVQLADPIRVALAPGSTVHVASVEANEIHLHLQRGRVAARVDRGGAPVVLRITAGEVVATTSTAVFSMRVAPAVVRPEVDVQRGTLVLQATDGRSLEVGPHQSVRFDRDAASIVPLDLAAIVIDTGLLSEPPWSLTAPPSEPEPPPRSTKAAVQLLADARDELRQGRPRRAARHYAELLQRHPRSHAAGPAMIALGRLYLQSLDRPDKAEALFRRYLESGRSALAIEARLGRVEALRRAHRRREEAEAIRELIRRHPESAHVKTLESRLRTLGP